MAYLVDTDVVMEHLADDPVAVQLLKDLGPSGVAISMVSYMETIQELLRSSDRVAAEAKFQTFLTKVPIIPFSHEIARRCAALREELRLCRASACGLVHSISLRQRPRSNSA
jgi:predicted nucleic acid-binding protein